MVGNLPPVTTALARTAASSVSGPKTSSANVTILKTGNLAPAGGQNLPVSALKVPKVDVDRAIARLNELASRTERNLRFSVDELTGRTVITVINAATEEVVRQIPSEQILQMARSLSELGLIVDAQV